MINKVYLDENVLKSMGEFFSENGFLVLSDFFEKECYEQTETSLESSGERKIIPDKYSYGELESAESEEVHSFIRKIAGEEDLKFKTEVKKFGHRDFTLLHDSETVGERYEFFIFVCDEWDSEWGGMKVYADSSDSDPLVFLPIGNTFCLVRKGEDMGSFIKYINNHAGENKFVLVEGNSED